ncbi:hypothetical protein [Streptomyces chiangmaiensis]|uniref:Uncharacterized protein n=1 Tax=Streptomyces chiangmaiensis TaxID=766497 RepID=A0ABU7FW37_9ACTN|nr:hypothetical protein [Streptomyces chiangmaiensis]MED7828335.1 hypothetical protein [Streptomyces chiangmaiensis]
MRRYVHDQLAAAVEAVGATAVSVPVAFAVRGVPQAAEVWWAVAFFTALAAVFGVLACTPVRWSGGKKRDFERAVPLADSERGLPAPGDSLRRSFDWGFPAFLAVSGLVGALLWGPMAGLWPLLFVPERLVKAAYGTYWERRHGVVLWMGLVSDQPLGKNEFLYSSVRQPGL